MGFRIATNVQSIAGQRTLGVQKEAQNHQLEKLSSGERIVRAADDAAGLAISEKFKAEIRSTRQAQRNTQDGISLIQVAEGGLNEVGNMLIRMRELSIQAATDTISDTERNFIDKEVQHLKQEMDRVSRTTKYNGIEVLTGKGDDLEIQVGVGPNPENDRLKFAIQDYDSTIEKLGVSDVNTQKKSDAQENLNKLDGAITKVSENRATMGALQNRLTSTVNTLMISDENLSAANSRIRDADIAAESADLTKRNILTQAGTATLAQANNNSMLALKLI